MIALAAAFRYQPFWASGSNAFLVILEGAVVGGVGLIGIWFLTFTPADREKFAGKFLKKLRRGTPAPAKP